MTKSGLQQNTITAWWLAARPKTLWAAISPVVLGGILALRIGSNEPLVFLVILCTAVLIQIATNLANDLIDARRGTDTEKRIGPTRVVQAGLLTEQQVQIGLYSVLAAALALGVYLVSVGGLPILLIGLAALICTIWYSAGPAALSYTGLADLFVFAFFGPIAVAGTVYLLVGVWSLEAALIGIAPGLLSTAVLVANNMRDYWTDRATGKKTLVVRLGLGWGRFEYIASLMLACLLPPLVTSITEQAAWFAAGTIVFTFPLIVRAWKATTAVECMPLLPGAAKLLVIYTALFGLGLYL